MPRSHRPASAPSVPSRARGLSRVLGLAAALGLTAGLTPAQAAGTAYINGLSDIAFGALNPFATAQSAQSLCVGSSSSKYSVTATGSGAARAFVLSAGGGLDLPYSVAWSPTNGASTGTTLNPSVALANQTTASLTGVCTISRTATVIVTISPTDLQAAFAGVTYTGVLTLVIAAQ